MTIILMGVVAVASIAGMIWLMMRMGTIGLQVNGSNVDVKPGGPGGASARGRAGAAAAAVEAAAGAVEAAAAEAAAAEAATERAGAV